MENNVITLDTLKKEARELLENESVHSSTLKIADDFLEQNPKIDKRRKFLYKNFNFIYEDGTEVNLDIKQYRIDMFSPDDYEVRSFIGGFFSPIGVFNNERICDNSFHLTPIIIKKLNDLHFYDFSNNIPLEKFLQHPTIYRGEWAFKNYVDFYNNVARIINRNDYTTCIICFYMIVFSISEIISKDTYFDNIRFSVPLKFFSMFDYTLADLIEYYLFVRRINDSDDSILCEELPYLICYIIHNDIISYKSIEQLIKGSYRLSKDIIDRKNYQSFSGEKKDIYEYNVFAIGLKYYLLDRKKEREEEEERKKQQSEKEKELMLQEENRKIENLRKLQEEERKKAKEEKERADKEYINLIISNSKKVLADTNIESAINRLIVSIPVKNLLSIYGYNIWRGAFIQDNKLNDIINPNTKYVGEKPQVLTDLQVILTKRYSLPDEYATEITWCVYNYCIIRKYSKKWLEICVTGEIGDRSIETYLSDCFNDDMISLDDEGQIAMFCYYIASTKETDDLLFDMFLLQPDYSEYKHIKQLLAKFKDENRTSSLESRLFGNVDGISPGKAYYTIDDIDLMTGIEFENFIKKLFIAMGYSADTTKASGDQGIDVIVEKNGIKYGIQAKCYSGTVGNSAVQEAVAGRLYYGLDKVIVITNSSFTKAAIKLAASNGAVLWDRSILAEKLIYVN